MPSFSEHSLAILETCDLRLVKIFMEVVKEFDCRIISGRRGETEQNKLYMEGLSQVKFPDSCHNAYPLSLAVDCAPWPIDWADKERFVFFGGYVMGVAAKMGIPIIYGGDWDRDFHVGDETFRDFGHFELLEEGE